MAALFKCSCAAARTNGKYGAVATIRPSLCKAECEDEYIGGFDQAPYRCKMLDLVLQKSRGVRKPVRLDQRPERVDIPPRDLPAGVYRNEFTVASLYKLNKLPESVYVSVACREDTVTMLVGNMVRNKGRTIFSDVICEAAIVLATRYVLSEAAACGGDLRFRGYLNRSGTHRVDR